MGSSQIEAGSFASNLVVGSTGHVAPPTAVRRCTVLASGTRDRCGLSFRALTATASCRGPEIEQLLRDPPHAGPRQRLEMITSSIRL